MVEIDDPYPNIWPINPVLLEPLATITNWSVIEAGYKDTDKKTHHLLGDVPGQFGRVSSAIQKYDRQRKTITTKSGRVYKLLGPVGFSDDAKYVWQNWKFVNEVINELNVSEQYE